jgi:hypothetical protein
MWAANVLNLAGFNMSKRVPKYNVSGPESQLVEYEAKCRLMNRPVK